MRRSRLGTVAFAPPPLPRAFRDVHPCGLSYVPQEVDFRSPGASGLLRWHPAWVIGTATYVPDFGVLESTGGPYSGFLPYPDRRTFHPPRPGWLRGMWLYDVRTGLMLRGITR